jgi:hypothetical protein
MSTKTKFNLPYNSFDLDIGAQPKQPKSSIKTLTPNPKTIKIRTFAKKTAVPFKVDGSDVVQI